MHSELCTVKRKNNFSFVALVMKYPLPEILWLPIVHSKVVMNPGIMAAVTYLCIVHTLGSSFI